MPVKRRNSKRRQELTDEQEAWLHGDDQGAGFFKFQPEDELLQLWEDHRDRIIAEHTAEQPGTRPRRWWQYDAPRIEVGMFPGCYYDGRLPQPRERIGGAGTPAYEVLAYVPSFDFGIPTCWVDFNEDDPPTFETEAAYLKRHRLTTS